MQLAAEQKHKYLFGLQPLRTLAALGAGVWDLFHVPYLQYKRDGRVWRGVRAGAASFVRQWAAETFSVTGRLAQGAQSVLESVEEKLTALVEGRALSGGGAGGALSGGGGVWVGRGGGSNTRRKMRSAAAISKMAHPPAHVQEGLSQAYASLSRGLHTAAHGTSSHASPISLECALISLHLSALLLFVVWCAGIVVQPRDEYLRHGPTRAVQSAVKNLPSALISPVIGMAEAISKTSMGIVHTISPDKRAELENKFKPPPK
jgi:autophagy-related protein 2